MEPPMQVCLFDIDGTLIHSGGAGLRALRSAMQAVFEVDADRTEVVTTGRTDRAIVEELFQLHDIDLTQHNWELFSQTYLCHLPNSLAACAGRILPGVEALLDQLTQREDVAVGLLTGNSHEAARHKLSHFGLYERFAFGGFGGEHLDRDDVARAALAAVHESHHGTVSAERIFVIGDTPLDVSCARAIGARPVAVASGTHTLEQLKQSAPELLVEDFSDPTPLLELLATV